MSIKGVKLKSESFFSISPGVLELWRENLRGQILPPPSPDRVKGRNNYKLRDLKAVFGFKPMITGTPVTISSDE